MAGDVHWEVVSQTNANDSDCLTGVFDREILDITVVR